MIVYIDGENAIHQLMDVIRISSPGAKRQELLSFRIVDFLKDVLHEKDIEVRYYTTSLKLVRTDPILEKKSREMMQWSSAWTNVLTSQGVFVVKAGKLKVRQLDPCPRCGHEEMVFREKGVDVRLAVDLIVDSAQKSSCAIWSSDSDLLPAIQVSKKAGSRVKNIAYEKALNWGFARQSGEWQTFDTKKVKEYLS